MPATTTGTRSRGPLVPTTPGTPHVIVCRRVVDVRAASDPGGRRVYAVHRVQRARRASPAGPHQDVPKICVQCARIEPLPMDA